MGLETTSLPLGGSIQRLWIGRLYHQWTNQRIWLRIRVLMGRVISDIRVFSEPGNRGAAPSYQNQFLELGFDYGLARRLVAHHGQTYLPTPGVGGGFGEKQCCEWPCPLWCCDLGPISQWKWNIMIGRRLACPQKNVQGPLPSKEEKQKLTAPGIPRRSPIQVLTRQSHI